MDNILSAMHMQRADDLFGMPNGTSITDRITEASTQWAERIMQRIDSLHSK
jgi:predicted Zn-dependent protease with MMP-like domain